MSESEYEVGQDGSDEDFDNSSSIIFANLSDTGFNPGKSDFYRIAPA